MSDESRTACSFSLSWNTASTRDARNGAATDSRKVVASRFGIMHGINRSSIEAFLGTARQG